MKAIGIDLGSNTLRVVKIDCNNLKKIAEFEQIVRTAEELESRGIIGNSSIERVIKALNEAKIKIDFNNAEIKAVTTQALRVAKNSKDVLKVIENKTKIKFEIIDAKMEAFYTLIAVKDRLKLLGIEEDFILIDIGGGSTEITIYKENKFYTKSYPLGIVTVANSTNSLKEIESLIKSFEKDIHNFLSKFDLKDSIFVSTAGTPTTIAALKHNLNYKTYNANIINGTTLDINELDYYLNTLMKMSREEREIAVGVGRDDLIVAGVLIFKFLYQVLDKRVSIIIDDGLREGLAIILCKEKGSGHE